ncbi:YfdQ family protein, partial [Lactococcus formosensis]
DFESGVREASGDVKLNYVEETTAKAGQKGNIEIPARIQLALRPYVGGPIYSIWASFRYRLNGGNVRLGFRLERPENVLE